MLTCHELEIALGRFTRDFAGDCGNVRFRQKRWRIEPGRRVCNGRGNRANNRDNHGSRNGRGKPAGVQGPLEAHGRLRSLVTKVRLGWGTLEADRREAQGERVCGPRRARRKRQTARRGVQGENGADYTVLRSPRTHEMGGTAEPLPSGKGRRKCCGTRVLIRSFNVERRNDPDDGKRDAVRSPCWTSAQLVRDLFIEAEV